jgi:hypothetical protein
VTHLIRRLKAVGIAIVALALSASLALGAQPQSGGAWGRANAAQHAGKTVPVETVGETVDEGDEDVDAGDEDVEEVEDVDEVGENESTEEAGTEDEAGDHCAVDPTTLTEEELAAMNHGAIVCWAAHQTEWPAEFKNHGAWVSSWAHAGKDKGSDAAKVKGNGKGNNSNSGD